MAHISINLYRYLLIYRYPSHDQLIHMFEMCPMRGQIVALIFKHSANIDCIAIMEDMSKQK